MVHMHKKFDHQAIEQRWQQQWAVDGIYDVGERDQNKEKEYVLVELPYPSGNLHIGHWYAFAIPDIYVRYRRMQGKQVAYPMGFDAFGLPAENAAIKHNVNPREWTEGNIAHMKTQLASMGAAFSWDKTASTIDPKYYKWTQWMFTQFFEKGIAYRGSGIVNWCPHDNTVIANEQVINTDECERCGNKIEKREMPQWMLKITDYADRLIDDLDELNWPEPIKDAQRNWIGRSEGAEIDFALSTGDQVTVFTTRPDTLYGATYMVLAPEHPLVSKNIEQVTNRTTVEDYVTQTKSKAEQDRLDGTKEKTGVKLEGITATNPANGEEIPVFIADYVLSGYGTGAIMAVPAHDERDFAFAKKFKLPIKDVVARQINPRHPKGVFRSIAVGVIENNKGEILIQSVTNNNLTLHCLPGGGIDEGESPEEAVEREVIEETGYFDIGTLRYLGSVEANYYKPIKKLHRQALAYGFSVQLESYQQVKPELTAEEQLSEFHHHWMSPEDALSVLSDETEDKIFLQRHLQKFSNFSDSGVLHNSNEFNGINSEEAKVAITKKVGGRMMNTYRLRDWSVGRQRYWGVPVPIVYDPNGNAHPIPKEHLPWTLPEDVDFRPTGEAPLAKSKELFARTEQIFGAGWTPEVETLDTFVDSSWYFLRYMDNQNGEELASKASQQQWLPIDLYFGGAEHTTMHLLYSRFWQKALYDLGLTIHTEPYTRRLNRGLILGPDGNKMSKSKGNVIDPDEQVTTVGSDAVKMYLAFMGPYGEVANYPWDLGGIAGQRRFLERVYGLSEHIINDEPIEVAKQLHKTIIKVSSDISQFKFNTAISAMMVFVNLVEKVGLTKDSYLIFLRILAPFAPHLTEELWSVDHPESIHLSPWPEANPELAKDDVVTIGVQINGKVRGEITIAPDADEATAVAAVHTDSELALKLTGTITKVIYRPGRILNFITR